MGPVLSGCALVHIVDAVVDVVHPSSMVCENVKKPTGFEVCYALYSWDVIAFVKQIGS